ncbi:virK protein [Salmonella enterica subsp. enterica]|uniref:VirK protein n=1 Tax=Salmonella enterica I TaxID=59201 RepID=A0A447MV25_SALET|nr:virK protein [Salmonella enterica subsp. enterica]
MRQLLSREQQVSYLSQYGLNLAKFETKTGELFQLDLVSLVSLDKEGESTIVVRDAQLRILAEITFTLCRFNQQRTLFIGGLQGAANDVPHEIIQQATKACHGLFPKRIVMEALCQFAQVFQAEKIIAVSNDAHVYRSWRYMDKKTQMHADYDAFWESLGGERIKGNYYTLPLAIARKSEAEIASKNGPSIAAAMHYSIASSNRFRPHSNANPPGPRASQTTRENIFLNSGARRQFRAARLPSATSIAKSGFDERWIALVIIFRVFIGTLGGSCATGEKHRQSPDDT